MNRIRALSIGSGIQSHQTGTHKPNPGKSLKVPGFVLIGFRKLAYNETLTFRHRSREQSASFFGETLA
jgi:hypothetical protein